MKKIIVLVLSVIMTLVCLTACGHDVEKITTSGAMLGSQTGEVTRYKETYYKVDGVRMTEDEYLEWKDSLGFWG